MVLIFDTLRVLLGLMLLTLLSKQWLIFAKSYYYRSMRYPMYDVDVVSVSNLKNLLPSMSDIFACMHLAHYQGYLAR